MSCKTVSLVHYGELSLKGRNRVLFENRLKGNIERTAGGTVRKYRGYFILENGDARYLKNIFGISWFAEAYRTNKDYESIERLVLSKLADRLNGKPEFGVFVRRADKRFSLTSMQTAERIGSAISEKFQLPVNLKNSSLSVFIEISDAAYLYFDKIQGLKGLPVDVSGKVLSLLSGGIDSPVASYLMMKRGCRVDFIHFHVFSRNELVKGTKMCNLLRRLDSYQGRSSIYLVPYYPFEIETLRIASNKGYEVMLFRRFMVRIAQMIALRSHSKALVTGDSLGQVASQTMENLAQVNSAAKLPIFQPLIAYDKQEIVDLAKRIGTYEASVDAYKDCCSIVSPNPRTRADSRELNKLEERMNMGELVLKTLGLITVLNL